MSQAVVRYEKGHLLVLDQTRLPGEAVVVALTNLKQVVQAISSLMVRGAPLIGVSAAYGVCVALTPLPDATQARSRAPEVLEALRKSRPTAVNLFWALDRMEKCLLTLPDVGWRSVLEEEANAIYAETLSQDRAMAEHGVTLLKKGTSVVTHCNTGPLATGGLGTALGVLIEGCKALGDLHVYVDETRPRWQGAHLTTWELASAGVPHTLIVDTAAATLMHRGKIHSVWVGADRIAANGDTANKIGTYPLAIAAHHHGVPFYVVAPSSTLDPSLPSGDAIPIEERNAEEVSQPQGILIAPENTPVWNPAFDVTPATLITAIISEKGIFKGPNYMFSH